MIRQVVLSESDVERSVAALLNGNPSASLTGVGGLEQLVDLAVQADGVVVGHLASLLDAQDRGQVHRAVHGPMGVVGAARLDCAPSVEPRQELLIEDIVGLFHRGGTGKPQFLDQPVLRRPVEAFDTPLGLRAVGPDPLDIQLFQRPGDLCLGRPLALGLTPEDAVTVGVDGHHPPVLAKVSLQEVHVAFSRLGRVKSRHDLAGGVVDHHQQGHARRTTFQPVVMAPVGLDQLPAACPAWPTGAVLLTLASSRQEAFGLQPATQRLARNDQPLVGQLLRGERGAEVSVALPVGLQNGPTQLGVLLPIRRPPSQPVDHATITFALQSTLKTPNLPNGSLQEPARLGLRSLAAQH